MKLCPQCGVGGVEIGEQLVGKPPGTWSLSGSQLKTVATMYAVATCSNNTCDWKVLGHLQNATFDNRGMFTGGHFVVVPLATSTPEQPDE